MRKQWVALLSMLGLAGSAMPVRSQVVNGSTSQSKIEHKQVKAVNGSNTAQKTGGSSKLKLNQQTLRQQNNGGKQNDPLTPSAYCNAANKGNANNQLTPPPPGGGKQQITKGTSNNAITKGNGNNAVTKGSGNNAITKGSGNNAVTKGSGNNAVTKGNGNNAVTKGSLNNAITKGSGNNAVTKGSGFRPQPRRAHTKPICASNT